ncbi:unnamed protein product [Xylocopa violacea]|uniref:Cytochrome b5 heme-binding domain-containing protein n=1 Tax=Xylocopa violacea TaxID=135666 RepID=A0ABP1N4P7_XYLVO
MWKQSAILVHGRGKSFFDQQFNCFFWLEDHGRSQKRDDIMIEGVDLLDRGFETLATRDIKPQQTGFLDLEKPVEQPRRVSKPEENNTTDDVQLKQLRTIALDEVAWHDTPDNCWVVVHDFVYDCTELLRSHPGGSDVILEYAGRDATLAFVGTGHSATARLSLERHLIGELPPEERIFRVPNGVKIFGF